MGLVVTGNVALMTSEVDPSLRASFPFAPRIGWSDVWRTGTITASSEGRPKELAVNGLTYDGWQPTAGGTSWIQVTTGAGPVDYIGVAALDLRNGSIKPQYLSGSTWTDMGAEVTQPQSGPIVWYFPRVMASEYRLLIQGSIAPPTLGVVMSGLAMVPDAGLPIGWQPPSLNLDEEYTNSISERGQLLGRQLKRFGASIDVSLEGITYPYARSTWQQFLMHARRRGFFFWWSFAGFAEVAYGGLSAKSGRFIRPEALELGFRMEGVSV
jgi:hypothetical protein